MQNLLDKAKKIKFILTDVDGVLTDGKLHFYPSGAGMEEFKSFSATDGLGTLIAIKCGLNVGIITGRAHPTTAHRATSLGMKYIYQGFLNKITAIEDIMQKENLSASEIAFIGDDVIDLAVMNRVGLTFAPIDGREDVLKRVDIVTKAHGGAGVLREVIETVLKAQDKWEAVVKEIEERGMHKAPSPKTMIVTSDGTH